MLEAHGLCKSYGSRAVVSDLPLTRRRGKALPCAPHHTEEAVAR